MNKKLHIALKIIISASFLLLALRTIDIGEFIITVKASYMPLAVAAVSIAFLLSFLTSLRWFILLKSQVASEKISYMLIWKLTMIGILFNNFLPTGAGGDIAKVFYLVKGEDKKLLMGGSVIVDRFIGALTIISMGVVAVLLTPQAAPEIKYLISFILAFLLFVLLFFANKRFAYISYPVFKKILPAKIINNLKNIYSVFNKYMSSWKFFLLALGLSFFLQSIAVFTNYLMSMSILWGQADIPNISLFFIYIPLIWTSTLIPSLGGLGVRELTYVFLFESHMGSENAFALSVMFLITVIMQSIAGAVIMLFLKIPSEKKKGSQKRS